MKKAIFNAATVGQTSKHRMTVCQKCQVHDTRFKAFLVLDLLTIQEYFWREPSTQPIP